MADAELYDPVAGAFNATGNPVTARYVQTASLLANGTVLVAGGVTSSWDTLSSAELYQPTAIVPPNLASIAVTPPNPSIPVGSAQNFTATGTFSDNSTQILRSVNWNSSNTSVATVTNDSGDRGVASGLTAGATTVSACAGPLCGSTTLAVHPIPYPTIASLSWPSASVGAQITIYGIGFGTVGTVAFNGTIASPISWTSSQIVTTVPPGATSGNIVVATGGLLSNSFPFQVVLPPYVTITTTPAPNASGWNHSNVFISYNCGIQSLAPPLAQNSCPASQVVSIEGANQHVTGNVSDAAGDASSTSVLLNIDKTAPTITLSSPADGSVLTSATVSVTGSASDALSGLASVKCNGTAVTTTGNFACNISLVAGVNLIVVQATDLAGNQAVAVRHVTYDVPPSAPAMLAVSPPNATVLIGGTQQFSARDQLGHPQPDATWTISDNTIATISSTNPAVLTGAAVGQVTLTASIGNVTAQAQVTVLGATVIPVGTAKWSAQTVTGFKTQRIIQAVPTSAGTPDLYAIDTDDNNNMLIRAYTADGQQMWSTLLPATPYVYYPVAGDAFGGLLVSLDESDQYQSHMGLADIDGQTGRVAWQNDWMGTLSASVGSDGSIYGVNDTGELQRIDPLTGQGKTIFSAPPTSGTSSQAICVDNLALPAGFYSFTSPNFASIPVIDADGNVFTWVYPWSGSTQIWGCVEGDAALVGGSSFTVNGYLVKLSPDGTELARWTNAVWPVVPDTQGGVLANVSSNPNSQTFLETASGASFTPPFDTTQIITGTGGRAFLSNGSSIAAMDTNSGQITWSHASTGGNLTLAQANDDGTLDFNDDELGLFQLDPQGNAIQLSSLNAHSSWKGGWYAGGGNTSILSELALDPQIVALGGGTPILGGDFSGGSRSQPPWYFVLVWQNDFSFFPSNPTLLQNLTIDISNSSSTIKKEALRALRAAYNPFPVTVVEGVANTGDAQAVVMNHQDFANTYSGGATKPLPNRGNKQNTVSEVDYIKT